MLHFRREVPVVAAGAKTEQGVVCIARGECEPAEVLIGQRAALAVQRAVRQVAVRDVVAACEDRRPDRSCRSTCG